MLFLRNCSLALASFAIYASSALAQDEAGSHYNREDNKPRFFCQCELVGVGPAYQGQLYQVQNGKVTALKVVTPEFSGWPTLERNWAKCNDALQTLSICN